MPVRPPTPVRPRITAAQRRDRLAVRHRLVPYARGRTPEEVTDAVVALHASDPASVHLSALARLADPGFAVDKVLDEALYEEASLVRMHGMRRTLFVVTDRLAPVLQASTMHRIAATERRSLDAFVAGGGLGAGLLAGAEQAVRDVLAEHGSLSAAQLGGYVPALRESVVVAPGKPYESRQTVGLHLLRVMAMEGTLVRGRPLGSWVSGQYMWALAEPHGPAAEDEARAALLREYLAAFGPATEADIKWWTGWPVTAVRKALSAERAQPVDLDDGGTGWLLPDDATAHATAHAGAAPRPEPWAALLPSLDPTAMGWKQRDHYLPAAHTADLFDRTGNIGPTVWWNGRIVGSWTVLPDGRVRWGVLEDVGRDGTAAIESEAARLQDLLAGARFTPRFPTPLERRLATAS
ncbi:winged helix DNA-binding domain-containing protein [Streptomyces iconiensis]|uniref:Winged helix DNA-binding domain-containing protein n=1 Tax=Streptomyces iconiensis TaxID=1384038 RepID=A0ABT6ZSA5_9ACTN|nr:winged helix DNA-binding domain-containing protein [Streptomyces iconiensis]MDJ1131924.1 winged helix DNA-binding domain-containing protein [Streptomyces iconiensis]